MRLITEILTEANAEIDAMGGSIEFYRRLHGGPRERDANLTRLKEKLALTQFAELCNASGQGRRLVWAQENKPDPGHADYTVWSDDEKWNRDLELTSVWEDENAFPMTQISPGVFDVEVSRPNKPLEQLRAGLEKDIERILERHAQRKKYPLYWLAIYVNFSRENHGVEPGWVSEVVALTLKSKPPSPNVERIWIWDNNGAIDRVFP